MDGGARRAKRGHLHARSSRANLGAYRGMPPSSPVIDAHPATLDGWCGWRSRNARAVVEHFGPNRIAAGTFTPALRYRCAEPRGGRAAMGRAGRPGAAFCVGVNGYRQSKTSTIHRSRRIGGELHATHGARVTRMWSLLGGSA